MRLPIGLMLVCLACFTGCEQQQNPPQASAPPLAPPGPPGAPAPADAANPAPAAEKLNATEKATGFSLKNFRGKQPVLLLYATTPETESYQKFNQQLPQELVQQHNLVIIDILNHTGGFASAQIRGGETLADRSAAELVDYYGNSPNSFLVALLDKQGKQVAYHKSYVEPTELLAQLPAE